MKHVSTCFGTHHLMFAEDANRTLWTSGGGPVVGWLNTKLWDETGDEEKAQGWTALIMDINGNGRRDEYVEPNAPVGSRARTSASAPGSTAAVRTRWRRRRTDRCGGRCSGSPARSSA